MAETKPRLAWIFQRASLVPCFESWCTYLAATYGCHGQSPLKTWKQSSHHHTYPSGCLFIYCVVVEHTLLEVSQWQCLVSFSYMKPLCLQMPFSLLWPLAAQGLLLTEVNLLLFLNFTKQYAEGLALLATKVDVLQNYWYVRCDFYWKEQDNFEWIIASHCE